MLKIDLSKLVPTASKVAHLFVANFDVRGSEITGATGEGLELAKYDRRFFQRGRSLQHALSVRSLIYLPHTSFNDYVFIFNKYQFHSKKLTKHAVLRRILFLYSEGRRLHLPRQNLYAHFGSIKSNPWPFKEEFNEFPLVRKLYFVMRSWPNDRISNLLSFSEIALSREGQRIDHQIARIRGFSPWSWISTIISILVSYFAIKTAGLNEFENFMNLIYSIDEKYYDLRNIVVVVVLIILLNFLFYLSGLTKISALEEARRKLEIIDFAIRIALSEKQN